MACNDINIRQAMGAETGGVFIFQGYEPSDPNGSFSSTGGYTASDVAITTIPDNWIFKASNTGLGTGFYRFKYSTFHPTLGLACNREAFQTFQVVNPRCQGNDWEHITCEATTSAFFIFPRFQTSSPCGVVQLGTIDNTNSPNGPGGSVTTSPPFLNFNPQNNDVGDHYFTHTAASPNPSSGYTLVPDCPDCNPVAEGMITVRPSISMTGANQVIDCSTGSCTFTTGSLINISNYTNLAEPYEGNWSFVSSVPDAGAPNAPIDLAVNGNLSTYSIGDLLSPNGANINVPGEIDLLLDFDEVPAGDYTFEYCVFRGGPCQSCEQVTLTLLKCNIDVNITSSPVTCNFITQVGKLGDINSTAFEAVEYPDSHDLGVSFEYEISSDCHGSIVTDSRELIYETVHSRGVNSAATLVNGGFIVSLGLTSTLSGDFDVPLAPTTATLSGPFGTITSSNLIFNTANPTLFLNSVETSVKNHLSSLGYSSSDYEISTVSLSSNRPRFTMRCRTFGSAEWVGMSNAYRKMTVDTDGTGVTVLTNSTLLGNTTTTGIRDVTITEDLSDYGVNNCISSIRSFNVRIALSSLVSGANSDYDNVAINSPLTSSLLVTSNSTPNCNYNTLTANVTGCTSTLSYLWSTGETTQSIEVPINGEWTVEVFCPDASCTATATKSIGE